MRAVRAIRGGDGAQVRSLAQPTNVLSLASRLVAVLGFGVMGFSTSLPFTTPWIAQAANSGLFVSKPAE